MKIFFELAMFFVFFLCSGTISFAASGQIVEGDKADQIESMLSWSAYNAQGEMKDGKFAYVIGHFGCPLTRKAMQNSEKATKNIQLRWVLINPDQYGVPETGFLATEKLPDAFMSAIEGKRDRNTDLQNKIFNHNHLLTSLLPYSAGYPSFVYKTPDGIRITPVLEDLLQDKTVIQPMKDNGNKALEKLEDPDLAKSGEQTKAVNRSQEFMHCYMFPDTDSPSLDKFNCGIEPGKYLRANCFEYNNDFLICDLDPAKGLKFYIKKNN